MQQHTSSHQVIDLSPVSSVRAEQLVHRVVLVVAAGVSCARSLGHNIDFFFDRKMAYRRTSKEMGRTNPDQELP